MARGDALCLLSTGHLLRILIPLEEPPHLTADLFTHVQKSLCCVQSVLVVVELLFRG